MMYIPDLQLNCLMLSLTGSLEASSGCWVIFIQPVGS